VKLYTLLDALLAIWKDCSVLYFFGLFNSAQSFKLCQSGGRQGCKKFSMLAIAIGTRKQLAKLHFQ